jgi:large conductance mechanosensitive channel
LLSGGKGVQAGAFSVRGIAFDWAGFINACITFVITAAALYFLVVYPLNRLAERRARGEEPPSAAPSEEIKLLTEIRDALITGRAAPGAVNDVVARSQQQQAPPRH